MPRLLRRLPQRTPDDCVICVVAMVLGYAYEHVRRDSRAYPQFLDGKPFEWWVGYMQDEGRSVTRRPFLETYNFWRDQDGAVGILGMTIEHMRARHVAAIDTAGVVDPADDGAEHVDLADYILARRNQGFAFDSDFLSIIPGDRMGATFWTRFRRWVRQLRMVNHAVKDKPRAGPLKHISFA